MPPPEPERTALAEGLVAFMGAWRDQESGFLEGYREDFEAALADIGWFKKLTTAAYERGDFALVFSDGTSLKPETATLVETLRQVAAHGIDPEPFALERLGDLLDAADAARASYEALVSEGPDGEASGRLFEVATELRASAGVTVGAAETALAARDLDDSQRLALDAVKGHVTRLFEAKKALNAALRDVDLGLSTRLFRYVFMMRYSKLAHPFYAYASMGANVEAVAEELDHFREELDLAALEAQLQALVPRHPHYPKLLAGLQRYRDLAEAHPEHLELGKQVRRLKVGSKGEAVEALQTRLIQEGYLEAEADGHFGEGLDAAIRFYQETHQLKVTGTVDRVTQRSLNKSYAARAQDIELALQRHRESELHQGEYPLTEGGLRGWVNIPAFEANFLRAGEIVRTHRVVVGNNGVETDESTGARGYFNRTRLFTSEMRTIVLNPTWKVPQRIKEQELDLELMEEPDYYEKHGYELRIRDDGTEEVVQLPGPGNALGLVKFLFPNRYSIYMHDTPKKRLFERPVRAFSHGCMRTHDPLALAKWILMESEGMTESRFEEILDSREEYGIALNNRIPMTVDYVAVGVHESGRMMFYSDVYRFDRDYRAGKTPYEMSSRYDLHQAVLVADD